MSQAAKSVADSLAELIQSLRELPGGASVQIEQITPEAEDEEKMAGEELDSTTRQIEEAMEALIAARPAKKQKTEIGFDTSEVTDAIMEAAISVATASQKLVQAAADSQVHKL